MRICDICFKVITEKGSYDIKDGKQTDYCISCFKRLNKKSTNQNSEKLIKEYVKLAEEKEENIEKLIRIISKESRNKLSGMLIKE